MLNQPIYIYIEVYTYVYTADLHIILLCVYICTQFTSTCTVALSIRTCALCMCYILIDIYTEAQENQTKVGAYVVVQSRDCVVMYHYRSIRDI